MTPPSSTLPGTGPKLSSQLCTHVVLSTKESHGTEETEPKREAVGAAGGRAGKKNLSEVIGIQIAPSRAPDARQKATGFGVCHSGFQSCFGLISPY